MTKLKTMTIPRNQLRAAVKEDSVNEENRTVELIWTTGAKGLRVNRRNERYYEELSLDPNHVDLTRLNDGAHPLLAVHNDQDLDAVIGVVERASTDGFIGTATVRFAKDEISERAFQKVKDKILRNVSVGYSVSEYTPVDNGDEDIPTYRATRWQPAEISIVPIGFDPGAKTRSEDLIESEVQINVTRSESSTNPIEETEMSEKNQPSVDTEALKKEAAQAERKRVTEIRSYVKEANLEDTLAEDFIQRELSVDEAKKNVDAMKRAIEASKKTDINSTVRVEIGADEADKKRAGIVEAILPRMDSSFKRADGNVFNGQSLLRMFEALITRRPGMTDVEYATRVMSSSDLPYILANSGEKAALKKYQIQPRTWSRWASQDTLRNYKTKDLVRSGDFASLEEVKENGEIKRGSFGEEREQVALKDYAKMLSFSRRMLINDDLGEIAKVIAQAGSAAARLENQLAYAILTGNPTMGDGTTLFHADHSNLGTGAALSDSSIGEAFQLMREQTSVDGLEKLNLAPKYLICGPQNEVLARKYMAQISPTQASNVNVFSNSLELIVDSEITTNDYFFAADQNLIPTVTMFHLEGQEQPRVDSRTNFETGSVDVKCEHACVAKAIDHRGLVKNANAS